MKLLIFLVVIATNVFGQDVINYKNVVNSKYITKRSTVKNIPSIMSIEVRNILITAPILKESLEFGKIGIQTFMKRKKYISLPNGTSHVNSMVVDENSKYIRFTTFIIDVEDLKNNGVYSINTETGEVKRESASVKNKICYYRYKKEKSDVKLINKCFDEGDVIFHSNNYLLSGKPYFNNILKELKY